MIIGYILYIHIMDNAPPMPPPQPFVVEKLKLKKMAKPNPHVIVKFRAVNAAAAAVVAPVDRHEIRIVDKRQEVIVNRDLILKRLKAQKVGVVFPTSQESPAVVVEKIPEVRNVPIYDPPEIERARPRPHGPSHHVDRRCQKGSR